MSNMMHGRNTATKKDTKMRIRAFPVSLKSFTYELQSILG